MADLAAKLDAVHAWLEAHPRVSWVECDGVRMPQATGPSVQLFDDDGPAAASEDAELHALETLLHSSGADPTPFLRKRSAA